MDTISGIDIDEFAMQPIFLIVAMLNLQQIQHGNTWMPFFEYDLNKFHLYLNQKYMAILMVAILYQVFVDKLDTKYKYHNLLKFRILAHIQKILNEEFSHYFNLQGQDSEESLLLLQVCIQFFFIPHIH